MKRSAVTFLKLSAMIPLWLSTTTAVVFPTRHTNIWKLNVPRDTTAIGARTVVIKHTNIKKELLQRDTTAVVSRTAVVCGYDRICLEEPRSYPLFYTKPRLTLPLPTTLLISFYCAKISQHNAHSHFSLSLCQTLMLYASLAAPMCVFVSR